MILEQESAEFEAMRRAMVSNQLRTNAVNDARIVTAMANVPRHAFLPEESAALAYRDTAVPLANGRAANLPIATGRLLTEARLGAEDKVLLIGAATGYTAAVLSEVVARVVAVESDPDLADSARKALADYPNVTFVEGPLNAGAADHAPFDAVVVDGAIESMPDIIVAQMRSGAHAVSGLVDRGVIRLASGRKTDGGFGLIDFADVDCVVLPGFSTPRGFSF